MDKTVLEYCRANFGTGNNRKQQMFCHEQHYKSEDPSWIEGDRMSEHFTDFTELMENGEIIWGVVIQANVLLYNEGNDDCPGELVYSSDPDFDDLRALIDIKNKIADLKGTEPDDQRLNEIAYYLTDEMVRVFGLEVPESIAGGLKCKISTTFFMRKHFPDRILSRGIMPILVYEKAGNTYATVVPSDFWPEDFIDWWESFEPLVLNESIEQEQVSVNEEELEDDLSSAQIRLYGLGISVVGIVLLAVFAGYPLYKAHNGADSIDVMRKLIFLGVFVLEVGVILMALGRSVLTLVKAVIPQDGYDTKLSDLPMTFWFIAISSVALILYAYSWYEAELEKLGFKDY